MAGRIPELYISALGTLKHRAVFCPLFSAFGPEPIRARLTIEAKVLVTTEALYHRKVAAIRDALPKLEHIILIGEGGVTTAVPRTEDFHRLLDEASPNYEIGPTDPEDMALLHLRAAPPVHRRAPSVPAVVAHHMTANSPSTSIRKTSSWCTADPGWVTGTSYGIIAPLTNGVTAIVDEVEFDAARWYGILQELTGVRVVHGPHGDPHDDEDRRESASIRMTCVTCASWRAWENRSIRKRSSGDKRPSAAPSTTTGGRPKRAAL
ncbi:MAG: hypothetical protein U0361_19680 [Nitrospiraceae bacterium]